MSARAFEESASGAETVPEPMMVSDEVISRCRREIERPRKRILRSFVNRLFRLRQGPIELGEGFQFGPCIKVPKGTKIGRYCYIGPGFECRSAFSMGDLCMFSSQVKIVGNDHGIDTVGTPTRLDFRRKEVITVFEADVWVGKGAIIRAGVRLRRGSVIAAGAVVVKDVEAYSVVAGVPAIEKRRRFTEAEQQRHDERVFGIHESGRGL